jgi:RNA polymerase sigma-70 factor (ECF subfamily)
MRRSLLVAMIMLLLARGAAAVPPTTRTAQKEAAGSIEERLARLEKTVATLVEEIKSLRASTKANEPPKVVKSEPANGADDVDPNLTEIKVTFSKQMRNGSWSWTQRSDDTFPETTGKPHYLEDGRTCVLPVKLQPGKEYYLSINSQRFQNFKDTDGRPAVPYPLSFKTKQ